jgi:hypothetical protein
MQHHYSNLTDQGPNSGPAAGMGQELLDELVDQEELPACAYAGVSGNGRMDISHNSSGNRQAAPGHHFGMTGLLYNSLNAFVSDYLIIHSPAVSHICMPLGF